MMTGSFFFYSSFSSIRFQLSYPKALGVSCWEHGHAIRLYSKRVHTDVRVHVSNCHARCHAAEVYEPDVFHLLLPKSVHSLPLGRHCVDFRWYSNLRRTSEQDSWSFDARKRNKGRLIVAVELVVSALDRQWRRPRRQRTKRRTWRNNVHVTDLHGGRWTESCKYIMILMKFNPCAVFSVLPLVEKTSAVSCLKELMSFLFPLISCKSQFSFLLYWTHSQSRRIPLVMFFQKMVFFPE